MFKPKRVLFEKGTLDTEVGQNIYNMIKDDKNIEVIKLTSNKIKGNIPGENLFEQYREGKETMVVSYKKSLKFQTCKPSANYQLPLVSGCMGRCEYCYLNTQLGDKPFVRVFVNTDEILEQAKKYIDERSPHITIFEGAATSDPIPIEPYTHSLKKTIEFLGKEEKGRFFKKFESNTATAKYFNTDTSSTCRMIDSPKKKILHRHGVHLYNLYSEAQNFETTTIDRIKTFKEDGDIEVYTLFHEFIGSFSKETIAIFLESHVHSVSQSVTQNKLLKGFYFILEN